MALNKKTTALAVTTGILLMSCPFAFAETAEMKALIASAKAEKPINIYDSTGKIVEMAKAFSEKYQIKATGIKVSANSQLEMIIRESQSNNVQGDVALITDAPAALAQLLPEKFVESYLPPGVAGKLPQQFADPLAISTNANVWAYNTEVYDKCPVSNIWDLTEPKWKGKIAFIDPLTKASYTDWFNQLATYGNDQISGAYKAKFGKDLKTAEKTAAAAWIKAFAANGPLITDADDPISDAVGAAGQKEPFIGLLSSAKFRDNKAKGYKLGLCQGMQPWSGFTYLKLALIAAKTQSPNAAKLFVSYLLSQDGIAPQMEDGKISTNPDVKMPADEPAGVVAAMSQLYQYDIKSGLDDFDTREEWQDFWRLSYKK